MRRVLGILLFVSAVPVAAFAQGTSSIVGFGGVSLNGFESHSPSLGATLTYKLIPEMQVVGEVGRIGNVLPTRADTLFSLARTALGVSAFYGEGGVRLTAPTGAVAPYAEATAGFARLDFTSDRMTLRFFSWQRDSQPVEAIDTLEPFHTAELERPA